MVLVAFQAGTGEPLLRPNAYGTTTDLTLFSPDPAGCTLSLEAIGFTIELFARRSPWFETESSDQAFIIAGSAEAG